MAIFEIGNNKMHGYARQVFRFKPVEKPGTGSPSNLQRPLHAVTLRAADDSLKKTGGKLTTLIGTAAAWLELSLPINQSVAMR